MKAHKTEEVLRYRPTPQSRSTVARHYTLWRAQKGIPIRCDVQACRFHTEPLEWLGETLPLILDHVSGNKLDNSPKNLQYVCPNCDSQLPTRGGANRGRVQEAAEGSFVLMSRDGKRDYHLIPEPARLRLTTYAPTVVISSTKSRK
jgi:hypothetical protein